MAVFQDQHAPTSFAERARQQFQEFLDDCGLTREQVCGKSILELGFGNGRFLDQCNKAGMIVKGLEVREAVYKQTIKTFDQLDLSLYDGTTIPVDDNALDFIVSFQVLEHVEHLETLFEECIRVLKPGGVMYHRLPNYQSFYEGHYKILWLPFLNKSSGRRYMKLIGKYTEYYESLNIIKPKHVRQLCSHSNGRIELISDGKEQFQKYLTVDSTQKIKNKFVRTVAAAVCRVKPLRWLVGSVLLTLDMYYPMLLLAKKKSH